MIDGTFDVAVDTPKLHRRGTFVLKSDKDSIAGILNVGELTDAHFTGTCADKDFTFTGEGDFPEVGHVEYEATGNVWGNSLDMKCQTNVGTITIFGTRIGGAAGDFKSSHEYMMAAASGDFSDDTTMYSGLYADGS